MVLWCPFYEFLAILTMRMECKVCTVNMIKGKEGTNTHSQ